MTAQQVRTVVLPAAVGTIGNDDEQHTTLELQGLTAAWLPGGHGLCLVVGGGVYDGAQIEPAVTMLINPADSLRLAQSIDQSQPQQLPFPTRSPNEVDAVSIGMGPLGFPKDVWGPSSIGGTVSIETFRLEQPSLAFPGRPHVIEIDAWPELFRVYLTNDEANDLKAVLLHQPDWFSVK